MVELMCQRGDCALSELLCRVTTNSCTSDDVKVLKSHELPEDTANYPTQALHMYRLNTDVDK